MELHAPRARADAEGLLLVHRRGEAYRVRGRLELVRVREQRVEALGQHAEHGIVPALVAELDLVEARVPLRRAARPAARGMCERLPAEPSTEELPLLRGPGAHQ